MSRHDVPSLRAGYCIVVGWDRPMRTYFAQVRRDDAEDDSEPNTVWLGGEFDEYPDEPAAMAGPLAGWAVLTPELLAQLRRDRAEAPPEPRPAPEPEPEPESNPFRAFLEDLTAWPTMQAAKDRKASEIAQLTEEAGLLGGSDFVAMLLLCAATAEVMARSGLQGDELHRLAEQFTTRLQDQLWEAGAYGPEAICLECGKVVTPDEDCTPVADPAGGPLKGYFCDDCGRLGWQGR